MAVQVISFNCILKNRFGQIISHTTNREVLTSTGQYSQLKALSKALENLRPGQKRTVVIAAADAYGYYDPKLSLTRRRKELRGGADLKKDDVVNYVHDGERSLYRVVDADSINVTLDANHPLAGQDLVFEVEGMESRIATAEEICETLNERSVYLH